MIDMPRVRFSLVADLAACRNRVEEVARQLGRNSPATLDLVLAAAVLDDAVTQLQGGNVVALPPRRDPAA